MPIDDRFNATAFRAAQAKGAIAARELADQLQEEILLDMQPLLASKLAEIVAALNDRGHDLRECYPAVPGELHFRDDQELGGNYQCKLRVALDATVSAGYADTIDTGEELIS